MRIPTTGLLAVLACIAAAPHLVAQDDLLTMQSALIKDGRVSVPSLLARYAEMMRTEPKNPAGFTLAAAAYDREESAALFSQALAIAPDFLPAHLGLARHYVRDEQYTRGFAEFQKALALKPADAAIRIETVNAAVKASRLPDAVALAGDDPALTLEIVHALVDVGKFDAAQKALVEQWSELQHSLESDHKAVLHLRETLVQFLGDADYQYHQLLERQEVALTQCDRIQGRSTE